MRTERPITTLAYPSPEQLVDEKREILDELYRRKNEKEEVQGIIDCLPVTTSDRERILSLQAELARIDAEIVALQNRLREVGD
ncbi:MAG: hypothetical protein PHV78_01850 [Patescibacteria group bacterium]|nr:hypothetical protein [Patescibacteria group bacterium]MDD5121107.1 hypothetical protein [Patescibacteria group bacterium]MDD5221921.1 hypothetical protein [Patescibacteria group bacterium]MDD5395974.1 hypothetical protein [Patescibacteria group bacterium]